MQTFKAKFPGKCAKCGATFPAGFDITWNRRARGVYYHAACAGSGEASGDASATTGEATIPTGDGSENGTAATVATGDAGDANPMAVLAKALAPYIAVKADKAEVTAMLSAFRNEMNEVFAEAARIVTVRVENKEASKDVTGAHEMLPHVLELAGLGMHSYLHGLPGTGKSTIAMHVAEALERRFGYVSLNPQTPESRLIGYMDAQGVYRGTVFYECYVNGGVFCIDELDNASAGLLTTLNALLENGMGAFPHGVYPRHADFVLVATGNTAGRGGDVLFPERRPFDAAFADRFVFVEVGYDKALEKAIAIAENKEHGITWLTWCRSVREFCTRERVRLFVTPRAVKHGARLLGRERWSIRTVADATVFKGIDKDTRGKVLAAHPLPAI